MSNGIDSKAVGQAVAAGMREVFEEFFPRGNQADPGKSSVENGFPGFSKPIPVPLPSKMELAIRWLKDHREDREMTGRDLSLSRHPEGVTISHKTWNDAKKALGE